jgi:hypothetical protein
MINAFPTLTLEPILTTSRSRNVLANASELAIKLFVERLKKNPLQAREAGIDATENCHFVCPAEGLTHKAASINLFLFAIKAHESFGINSILWLNPIDESSSFGEDQKGVTISIAIQIFLWQAGFPIEPQDTPITISSLESLKKFQALNHQEAA